MTTTITRPTQAELDGLRAHLSNTEKAYRALQDELAKTDETNATAEQTVRLSALRATIGELAADVVEARTRLQEAEHADAEWRREHGEEEVQRTEAILRRLVAEAEDLMGRLAGVLGQIIEVSRRRYSARHSAVGHAPRSWLARPRIAAWIQHRLAHLDVSDLGRPPRHHRAGLLELLAIPRDEPDQETDQ